MVTKEMARPGRRRKFVLETIVVIMNIRTVYSGTKKSRKVSFLDSFSLKLYEYMYVCIYILYTCVYMVFDINCEMFLKMLCISDTELREFVLNLT